MSRRAIAKLLKWSPNVVNTFLKDPREYGWNFSNHIRSKVSAKDKALLFHEVSKTGSSSSKLVGDLNLTISNCRVRQLLNDSKHFKFAKWKEAPTLTCEHKQ